MKQQVKKLVRTANRVLQGDAINIRNAVSKELQILLSLQYRMLARTELRPSLRDAGFNVYSTTDEDGILLYIFSLIGMRTRIAVDIGAGGLEGGNSVNLIVNHGFTGLLVDGNEEGIGIVRDYFASHTSTKFDPPAAVAAMVTRENVNDLIASHGIRGEIDLLSIDIDGNDYWVWDAIDVVDPAVVVIEYQDILGPDRSWTIPYRADFDAGAYEVNREHRNYVGASLRAMTRLGERKGYRLVGTNRGGWNAFFVKNGRGDDLLPAIPVESCFGSAWNRFGMEKRFPLVAEMEWVEV